MLKRAEKPALAYVYSKETNENLPVIMFCGGYRSDMGGTKAIFLEAQCKARGQGYIRFDYSGHGDSEGAFENFTISDWCDDALDIFKKIINKPVIIVGSSMGGWIALLMALRLQNSKLLRGVVGLAAAPDFTEAMFNDMNAAQQAKLMEKGVVYIPNEYSDEPYAFTQAFYKDGKRNLLLNKPQHLSCQLTLIQGREDNVVPWQTAVKIRNVFGIAKDNLIIIENGDHRLSSPEHLNILWDIVSQY